MGQVNGMVIDIMRNHGVSYPDAIRLMAEAFAVRGNITEAEAMIRKKIKREEASNE
jgi:hypothetical protein|tara:strand:- start:317 stop:484 length:168 start_codon:yes stop_codon:yes gene_type:complete